VKRYTIEADSIPGNDTWADAPCLDIQQDDEGEWMKADDVVELLRDCFPHVPGQLKDRIADLGIIEFENDQE